MIHYGQDVRGCWGIGACREGGQNRPGGRKEPEVARWLVGDQKGAAKSIEAAGATAGAVMSNKGRSHELDGDNGGGSAVSDRARESSNDGK